MLYLAHAELHIDEYMSEKPTKITPVTRLVEADDDAQAREKLEQALERPDPYGTNTRVYNIELHPVIR